MFNNASVCFVNKWTMLCFNVVISIGSVIKSGLLDTKKEKNALISVLFAAVIVVSALLLCALHPQSPLLSVSGEIKNSPYIHGLPTIIIWCIIFLSAFYALLSQRVKTAEDLADLLTYGIRRFSSILMLAMLLSFITFCVTYIININI